LVHYEGPEQAGNEPPASGSGARASNKPLASGSRADLLTASSDPEVMKINEDPSVGSDPLPDWRVPYLDCLVREILSINKIEARWLARRAKSYIIIEGELYKKSHTKVLQCSITTEQGRKLLEDIDHGTCGHHAALRSLIRNAFR
jgi:hypothetical protein